MRALLLTAFLLGSCCFAGCSELPKPVVPTARPSVSSELAGLPENSEPLASATLPSVAAQADGTQRSEPRLSASQTRLLAGARGTLGDRYDDAYYGGGPPPKGRGACTDVVYAAYLADGLNLQDAIEEDIASSPAAYPNLGDANINYRRAPNLIVWFERKMKAVPAGQSFLPGDVVFWSLLDDGVADHVGIVSDRLGSGSDPLVIHNFPPACREDDVLRRWKIQGHFRRP